MLVDCPILQDIRQKHFTAASLEDIFQSVDSRKIIDFTKETHFITPF